MALPNSSDPLGTAQPESRLLGLSPSAGSTPHHGGLAAQVEVLKKLGMGMTEKSGEELQEYEAKLQTIFC